MRTRVLEYPSKRLKILETCYRLLKPILPPSSFHKITHQELALWPSTLSQAILNWDSPAHWIWRLAMTNLFSHVITWRLAPEEDFVCENWNVWPTSTGVMPLCCASAIICDGREHELSGVGVASLCAAGDSMLRVPRSTKEVNFGLDWVERNRIKPNVALPFDDGLCQPILTDIKGSQPALHALEANTRGGKMVLL